MADVPKVRQTSTGDGGGLWTRRLVAWACGILLTFSTFAVAQAASLVRFQAPSPALPGGHLQGELTRPAGAGPSPAVVLMHGCAGWQGGVRHALRSHARLLAEQGFVVLSLDSFGPRGTGNGELCASNERLREALSYRTHDAFAALRYLRTLPFVDRERIFLVGQSNGGSVALLAAEYGAARRFNGPAPGFAGVVALYPWCGALGSTDFRLEAPALVLVGGQDDWTPPDECLRFRSTGEAVETRLFENAAHSFDVLAPRHRYRGYLLGYDHEATVESRRLMVAFFNQQARQTPVRVADAHGSRR